MSLTAPFEAQSLFLHLPPSTSAARPSLPLHTERRNLRRELPGLPPSHGRAPSAPSSQLAGVQPPPPVLASTPSCLPGILLPPFKKQLCHGPISCEPSCPPAEAFPPKFIWMGTCAGTPSGVWSATLTDPRRKEWHQALRKPDREPAIRSPCSHSWLQAGQHWACLCCSFSWAI
jgi:hypothetical protein